jgi:Prenyltransferase and squalene oxidase repeat
MFLKTMISSGPRSRTLDFLKASENPDGGWGYRAGGKSAAEPSAFAAMALLAGAESQAAGRGMTFLRSCRDSSGGLGVAPGDASGGWMAYAGLLAFQAFGVKAEAARLADWILKFEDAASRFSPADIAAIAKTYRYDASIPGWSWTPGATAWVEPTALFILALIKAGVAPTNARILAGAKLLMDRKVPSGGWNFGNPFSKSYELPATPLSTAIALTALAATGASEDKPAVAAGLRFLERSLGGDLSTVALAWTLVALQAYRTPAGLISRVGARLDGLRRTDGSFRGNPFESALVFLALEDSRLIVPQAGERTGEERHDPA